MTKRLFLHKILPIIFAILIASSLAQTYNLMKNHFTHGDDIGIAYTFLKEDFFRKACEKNILKKEAEFLFRALGNDKERFCHFYYYPYIYTVIPRNWTYAPFQFWITQALLKPENVYSYEEVKLRGRLPSFALHILGLLMFFLLIKKKIFSTEDGLIIPLSLTLLAAFSLEQRIMASQMQSYAIGLMSNCFVFFAIFELRRLPVLSKKQLFGLSLVLALAVAMQYQALFLVFSGIMAVALVSFKKEPSLLWLKNGVILGSFFLLCLILTVAILFLRHIGRSVNWNAGPSNEFIVNSADISGKISEFITLIWNESPYNFYSILSSIELEKNLHADLLGTIFLFIFFLGFVFLFVKRKIPRNYFLLLMLSIYAITFLVFVFLGKFSYSPTRHFLYFLPVVLILIGHGLLLLKPKNFPHVFDVVLVILIFLYASLSLKAFSIFEQKRVDVNNVFNVPNIFFNSGANQILLDQFDMEPFFMPELFNTSIYRYRPKPLCKDYPPLSVSSYSQSIKILWYSKRVILDQKGAPTSPAPFQGGAIKNFFIKVIEDCHPNLNIKHDSVTVKKISDLLIHNSNVEIDLSTKTKNGSNELFLQTFEVQFRY